MSRRADMNAFLEGVEKRAFNLARYAVGNKEDALDIVQDTMLTLVRRYGKKPREQWPPLFFRILRNRITDHHRRSMLQRRLFGWLTSDGHNNGSEALAAAPDTGTPDPATQLAVDNSLAALDAAVETLPPRQQQVFLLRTMEGMSVADTAQVMGCSRSSVKTHHARALKAIRDELEDNWM